MTTAPRAEAPRCKADIMAFVQGADPALVTNVLAELPPSFYVVGAPRCGTSALSHLFMPELKIPEKTDIVLRMIAPSANSINVSGGFDLYLIDN